jgi:hypothetical protein
VTNSAPGSDNAAAWAVILVTIFVIVWDALFSSTRSTVLTVRDIVRYRLIRGTYHTVAYKWRWRVVEKVRLLLRRRG